MNDEPLSRVVVLSELAPEHNSFAIADARVMAALHDAEDRHFWHVTRREFIVHRLAALGVRPPSAILELGCGTGAIAAELERRGFRVVGVEGHRTLAQMAASRARHSTFWVHDLRQGLQALPQREFDAVGMFDVLEHLPAPLSVVREAVGLVKPGGLVVGTVPAQQRLWSRVDEVAGHLRRYHRDELGELLSAVGGVSHREVLDFNRVLVPLMLAQRAWVSRRGADGEVAAANHRVPSPRINRALAALVRAEHRLGWLADQLPLRGASLWFALRRGR